jgi:predicted transcriptional regulator
MADTTMKSIFDSEPDEAEEARLDAEADAAIEAGQFVTHDRVVEWLKSWGTPNELPCPKPEPR